MYRLVNEAHRRSQSEACVVVVRKQTFWEGTRYRTYLPYSTILDRITELSLLHSSTDVFNLLNAHRKLYLHITQEMLPSKDILRELTEHYG